MTIRLCADFCVSLLILTSTYAFSETLLTWGLAVEDYAETSICLLFGPEFTYLQGLQARSRLAFNKRFCVLRDPANALTGDATRYAATG